MRWVSTGVLMAAALVIIFKCFFAFGQEWMMIPAAVLCLTAVAINLNVSSEEPSPGPEHLPHD